MANMDRVVACVNALAGVEDPAKAIAEVKANVRAVMNGLDSGKGSVPFMITCLRACLFHLGEKP